MPLFYRPVRTAAGVKKIATVRIHYTEHGRKRQKWKSLGTTRRPSAQRIAETEADLWREVTGAGAPRPKRPKEKVDALVSEYLEWVHANRSAGHHRRVTNSLRSAERELGGEGLEAWTVEAVERWLQEGLTGRGWASGRKPWSARTANLHRSHLARLFRWAQGRGAVEASPMGSVGRAREKRQPIRPHRPEEILAIIEACDAYDRDRAKEKGWLPMAVRVALGTGMRRGELYRLEWGDVDFARGRVLVRAGKTGRGREIPLAPVALAALQSVPLEARIGRVFPSWEDENHRALLRALEGAQLPPAGWHSFRHDYASHLAMANTSIAKIQGLLGHQSITTTMVYAHLLPGSADEDVQALRIGLPEPAPVAPGRSRGTRNRRKPKARP